MIRIILEYIEYKLKDSENRVAKFIIKCLQCCFWCLEKFLKFLNKNAYIMIAIHGKNFCFSAKDAFMLIMRNIVRLQPCEFDIGHFSRSEGFSRGLAKVIVKAADDTWTEGRHGYIHSSRVITANRLL
ncbi:choline transporter-like protein 2 [Elysia marginata]|uniref:Choline transporter-like protein n=1 Tax=Elysia marginata TaxID=1093978 RepID=A0AAV4FZH8_9GAST|nr:choline transporter-like protein 2 [Elysia marginata]